MSINLDVIFEHDPLPGMGSMLRGGFRIEVDSVVLTRFDGQEGVDWIFDWQPDYVGEHIRSDLLTLIRLLLELERDEINRYEHARREIVESRACLVFEPLSDNQIRIAFQSLRSPLSEYRDVMPPVESELGYATDIDEFRQEVVSSSCELLSFAESVSLNDGSIKFFREALDELRDAY